MSRPAPYRLANAAAWRSSTWQSAAVVGPALGGLVYGFASPRVAYVADAFRGAMPAMPVRTSATDRMTARFMVWHRRESGWPPCLKRARAGENARDRIRRRKPAMGRFGVASRLSRRADFAVLAAFEAIVLRPNGSIDRLGRGNGLQAIGAQDGVRRAHEDDGS